jgi:hypothetical protein
LGQDPDPGGPKITTKIDERSFMILSAGCSLLRAEGFSISLDVLYLVLRRNK